LTAGPTARAVATSENEPPPRNNSVMKAMTPPLVVSSSNPADAMVLDGDFDLEESSPMKKEDAIMVQEALQDTDKVVQTLTTQLKYATSLKLAVRACINIADDISNRHADLIRHSGELSAAADRLQDEEQLLSRHAEEIGLPLQHYDAVDRIGVSVGVLFKGKTTVRGLAKVKVDSDEFPLVLEEIDKAIVFFGNECGGKEALQAEMKRRKKKEASAELTSGNIEYYRRALALQEAALDLVKEAVAERINTTTQQISMTLNIAKGNVVQADQLEASIIYTRFHGISSRSNRLISLVKSRIATSAGTLSGDDSGVADAYQDLLQHCGQVYCSCRESLLRTTVRSHVDKLKDQHGAVGMARLASVFLIRLCTIETALYHDFFGSLRAETSGSADDSTKTTKKRVPGSQQLTDDTVFKSQEFQSYLASLCSSLHRTLRRALVTMIDLDSLCQIVSVLREERAMASASPTTMAAARAMTTVIQDAQERLIFCANSTLTKDVVKFQATPADLNYPDKLRKTNNTMDGESTEPTSGVSPDDDAVELQLQQVYDSWFPPIRVVLKILSKIFRVVETRVFEDMALQSVRSCSKCLKDGAEFIKAHKSEMDADLFLVKHFLILREQLSPFDIELRSVERQLDFSDAGKAVARFLANRNRRVFSVSTENALITLLREGVSVQESSVDSKRDLEDALRSSCNDFIEHTSRYVAHDLLDAVESYKSRDTSSQLRSAESVIALLKNTRDTSESSLTEVKEKMSLYLDNPATQAILLKPVSRKITRALEEVRKLAQGAEGGVNGWDDEQKGQVVSIVAELEETIKSAGRAAK
jgi:conserved oligomeric Golgi complex subunit 3